MWKWVSGGRGCWFVVHGGGAVVVVGARVRVEEEASRARRATVLSLRAGVAPTKAAAAAFFCQSKVAACTEDSPVYPSFSFQPG